jgi:hypothetical protein
MTSTPNDLGTRLNKTTIVLTVLGFALLALLYFLSSDH